nr:XrtA/PEP-CTERM system TPR-repeat protein PrsT [uncultured Duganella sp.]
MSILARKNRRTGAVAGACVLLAAFAGCARQPSAEELIAEARQMQQKRDHNGAIIQLKNALQLNAGNAEARLLLAGAYNDAGDPLSAEKEARKAVSLGLPAQKALPVLAGALLRQGKYADVLKETAVAGDAPGPDLLIQQGQAHLGLGELPAARQRFDAALRARPKDAGATTGLAQAAALERDMEQADRYAAQAVADNPRDLDAWKVKGSLERVQGRIEDAERSYGSAQRIDPADADVLLQKTYLYIDANKFDDAARELDLYKKVAKGSLLVPYTQALLAYKRGDTAAALEPLQQVLKVAPDHMPALLLAGAVQFKLGAIAQAELHLAKYLERDPDNLGARKLLVSTLLQAKRPQDAAAALAPTLKDPAPDAYVLALAAEAAMQSGDFAKAGSYYERASALAPDKVELRTSLGLSLLGAGDQKRAMAELERATALDAAYLPAGLALVRTALGLKQYDLALAAAAKLAAAHPDDADVTFLIGSAQMGKRDPVAARASYERSQRQRPGYYVPVAALAVLDAEEGKPDAAKARLIAFLEQDKKNMDAMTALSALATKRGDAAEATSWLEKSLAANPDAVYPALRLAADHLNRGQYERGLTLARKTSAANPGNIDALDILGQAQLVSGKPVDAVETYSQSIKLAPASARARYQLAGAQAQADKGADAIASLKKALQIEPDYVEAKLALAGLAQRADDMALALTLARDIQRLRPKSPAGLLLEADLLVKQKKLAPAIAVFERALALAPDAAIKIKLAYTLSLAGKGGEAEQRLARWIKEAPAASGTVPLRMYLAQLAIAGGRYAQAGAQLEAVLAARGQPNAPGAAVLAEASNNLAYVYQQLKDPRALSTAEQALALAPENPAVLDTAGWLLVERGDTVRGLPLLRKAATLAPSSVVHYHLAHGLSRAGDKPGAKKMLEELLARDPRFPEVDGARALLKQL